MIDFLFLSTTNFSDNLKDFSDVSYYSSCPLFESPHHHQMNTMMEALMFDLVIRPALAVTTRRISWRSPGWPTRPP